MKCPFCQHPETRVIDSRPAEENTSLRRRRVCESCEGRFTTHERYMLHPLMVVKRDGRREEFSSEKLRSGLATACNKRPVPTQQLDEAVSQIEQMLRGEGLSEVQVDRIGELVMDRLYVLDEVAYVRFASVYQQFDDVKRFAQLLDRISRRGKSKKRGASGAGDSRESQGAPDSTPGDRSPSDVSAPQVSANSASTTGTCASGTARSGTVDGTARQPGEGKVATRPVLETLEV